MYDDEMGRTAALQARRQTDATPGNPDNTEYESLQPGLRVSSNYLLDGPGDFYSFTCGVLIKSDVTGVEFMTVASHSSPVETGVGVFHPFPSTGRQIGQLVPEAGRMDISLVELRNGETFHNTTFENEITPTAIHLKQLRSPRKCKAGDTVYLDSPDTGCIEGSLGRPAYQRTPSDNPLETKHHWVRVQWYYMGQDDGRNLREEICGSAILVTEEAKAPPPGPRTRQIRGSQVIKAWVCLVTWYVI